MSDPMEDSNLSLGARDGDGILYWHQHASQIAEEILARNSSKLKRSINFTVSLDCLPGRPIDVVYNEPTHGPNMPVCAATSIRLNLVPNTLPPGTGTLTYPGHLGQIASVSGLHGSIIEDRSPLLAASFESSTSGRRLHLETLSSCTVMPFLRFIYTGSYAASGEWEDVPTSVLLHCTMYWLGHLYDLPDLKSQSYVNVLRQFEFGCSSPAKPIDLCKAIEFVYKTLSGHETITDAIVQYCVTCCLSHKLHEDSEFRDLAFNVRAFHQDLTRACRNRGYEDESSAVIIQLPYKHFAPETYASRENPPIAGGHDIVHHFHAADRFDDDTSPKKKQRVNLRERRASSPMAIPRVPGTLQQPATVATTSAEETLPSQKVELPIRQRAADCQTPIYAPFNRNEPSKDNAAVPIRQGDDGVEKLSTAPPGLGFFDRGRWVGIGTAKTPGQFHRDGLIAEVQKAGSMWSDEGPKYGVGLQGYVEPRFTLPRGSDIIEDPSQSEYMRKYGLPDYGARIAAICKKHEQDLLAESKQESDKKVDSPISGTFQQQQFDPETTASSSTQSSRYFDKTESNEPQEQCQTVGGNGDRRHRYKRLPNGFRHRALRGVNASSQDPLADGAPSNTPQASAGMHSMQTPFYVAPPNASQASAGRNEIPSPFEQAKGAKPYQPTTAPHKDFDPTNPWRRSTFTHLQPQCQSRADATSTSFRWGDRYEQAYWDRATFLENANVAETSGFTPSNVSPTLPPTVFGDQKPENRDSPTNLVPNGSTLAEKFLRTDRDLTSSLHINNLERLPIHPAQGRPLHPAQGRPLHPPGLFNQPEAPLPHLKSTPDQLNEQNLRKSESEHMRPLNMTNAVGAAAASASAAKLTQVNAGNGALQDYETQLRLLEQQNGKPLIMARSEQDAIHRTHVAASGATARREREGLFAAEMTRLVPKAALKSHDTASAAAVTPPPGYTTHDTASAAEARREREDLLAAGMTRLAPKAALGTHSTAPAAAVTPPPGYRTHDTAPAAAATPAPDLSHFHPLQDPQFSLMLLEQEEKKRLLMARFAREEAELAKHKSDEPTSATSTTGAECGSEGPDSFDFDAFLRPRFVCRAQPQQAGQPKPAVKGERLCTGRSVKEREQQGEIAAMYGVDDGARGFRDLLDAAASAQHRDQAQLPADFMDLCADKATSQPPATAQEQHQQQHQLQQANALGPRVMAQLQQQQAHIMRQKMLHQASQMGISAQQIQSMNTQQLQQLVQAQQNQQAQNNKQQMNPVQLLADLAQQQVLLRQQQLQAQQNQQLRQAQQTQQAFPLPTGGPYRAPTDDLPTPEYPMHLITCDTTTDKPLTENRATPNVSPIDMPTSKTTPSGSDVDMCETDSDSDMSWVDVPIVAAKPADGTEQADVQVSAPDSSSKSAPTDARRSSTPSDSEWDLC
jgi:hypothetical protein